MIQLPTDAIRLSNLGARAVSSGGSSVCVRAARSLFRSSDRFHWLHHPSDRARKNFFSSQKFSSRAEMSGQIELSRDGAGAEIS